LIGGASALLLKTVVFETVGTNIRKGGFQFDVPLLRRVG